MSKIEELVTFIQGHDEHTMPDVTEAVEAINQLLLEAITKIKSANDEGMFIDPHKSAGVLVAEHRVKVLSAIEAIESEYRNE